MKENLKRAARGVIGFKKSSRTKKEWVTEAMIKKMEERKN